MLSYQYTARNPATGQQVKASVEADSEAAAAKLIGGQGLGVTDIRSSGGVGNRLGKFGNRVPIKDRVLFSRQLSTLINAGLPLLQALRSVNQQPTSKPLKVVLNQVIGDLEGACPWRQTVSNHPLHRQS